MKISGPHADRLRALYADIERVLGVSPNITSSHRTASHNARVGGAPGSAHVSGYALDLTVPGYTSGQVAFALSQSGLSFDQLIDEGDHVHISVDPRMRGQELTGRRGNFTSGLADAVSDLGSRARSLITGGAVHSRGGATVDNVVGETGGNILDALKPDECFPFCWLRDFLANIEGPIKRIGYVVIGVIVLAIGLRGLNK